MTDREPEKSTITLTCTREQADALLDRVTCRMLARSNALYALENPREFDPQCLRIILDGMVSLSDETIEHDRS